MNFHSRHHTLEVMLSIDVSLPASFKNQLFILIDDVWWMLTENGSGLTNLTIVHLRGVLSAESLRKPNVSFWRKSQSHRQSFSPRRYVPLPTSMSSLFYGFEPNRIILMLEKMRYLFPPIGKSFKTYETLKVEGQFCRKCPMASLLSLWLTILVKAYFHWVAVANKR